MSTINQRVAHFRKLADLTQTEAAEKLGIKCSTYSQMERRGKISAQRLLDLAAIFNVEPDDILYEYKPQEIKAEPLADNPSSAKLHQEPFYEKLDFNAPFVFSKKEENIIKIIRNLSKEDREEVLNFIAQKHNK